MRQPVLLDNQQDTLLNPQLIVEVLSPSTENYDRGEKFRRYRQIESLTDYLLIAQDRMLIEHWNRQGRQVWAVAEYTRAEDKLRLATLDVELLLADIYDKVEFPTKEPPFR